MLLYEYIHMYIYIYLYIKKKGDDIVMFEKYETVFTRITDSFLNVSRGSHFDVKKFKEEHGHEIETMKAYILQYIREHEPDPSVSKTLIQRISKYIDQNMISDISKNPNWTCKLENVLRSPVPTVLRSNSSYTWGIIFAVILTIILCTLFQDPTEYQRDRYFGPYKEENISHGFFHKRSPKGYYPSRPIKQTIPRI